MTLLKIIFVFMYFKVLELGGVLWRFVKYLWKEWVLGFTLPLIIIFSCLILIGGGILGICYGLGWSLAMNLIMHCVEHDGLSYSYDSIDFITGMVVTCFMLGAIALIGLGIIYTCIDGIRKNWYYVSERMTENWVRAKQSVLEGDKS